MFQRDENNIYVVFPITYSQAVLGDTITVPSIDGKVEVNVPEGTQSGTTFRLRGKGVQYVNGRGRGDTVRQVRGRDPPRSSAVPSVRP